jgi:hypothetical protein
LGRRDLAAGSSPTEVGAKAKARAKRLELERVPRLALSKEAAAAALDVSVDIFQEHVQPDIRVVRMGRRVVVPVAELTKWLEANAGLTLPGDLT